MEFLSPRRLASAVGVSESTIKRWVDDGRIASNLTVGGHRRIPLSAAIRFVRETHVDLVDPIPLGLSLDASPGPKTSSVDPVDLLFRHLLDGKADSAVALVRSIYASGAETARIIDESVRVAMERCAELWKQRGSEGVFLEHRATQIVLRALQELRAMQPSRRSPAPLAIGGAPSGDPYQLPTLAAATVLESVGFKTSNLGPDMPLDAFLSAIDNLRPDLVWISVTSARNPADLERLVRSLAGAARANGGSLALGGRSSGVPKPESDTVSFHGDSMVELAAFARGLIHSLGRSIRKN